MTCGRGKMRGFMKREIREGKLFTFWIYDFRTEEHLWDKILISHSDCQDNEGYSFFHQNYSSPLIYRLVFFKCFNCSHLFCWAKKRKEWKNYYPSRFNEQAEYWTDEGTWVMG